MRKRTFLLPFVCLALGLVAVPMGLHFRASMPRNLGRIGVGSIGFSSIDFSRDSRSLLCASSFGFEWFNLASGQRQSVTRAIPSRKIDGYPGVSHAYAGAPDEKNGLLATNIGTFLFQSNKPQLKRAWPESESPVYAVAVSSDGKLMAGGHQLAVWTVHTEDGCQVPNYQLWKKASTLDPPASLQFSPRGTWLAVGYFNGRVELKESRTGKTVWVTKAPTPFPTKGLSYFPTDPLGKPVNLTYFGAPTAEQIFFPMAFLSEERLAYSNGRATFICDAETGKVIHTLPRAVVYDLAAFADGKTLAIAGGSGGEFDIGLWNTETGRLQQVLENSRRALCLAVSPDQRYIAALEDVNGLKLWKLK